MPVPFTNFLSLYSVLPFLSPHLSFFYQPSLHPLSSLFQFPLLTPQVIKLSSMYLFSFFFLYFFLMSSCFCLFGTYYIFICILPICLLFIPVCSSSFLFSFLNCSTLLHLVSLFLLSPCPYFLPLYCFLYSVPPSSFVPLAFMRLLSSFPHSPLPLFPSLATVSEKSNVVLSSIKKAFFPANCLRRAHDGESIRMKGKIEKER